MGIEVFTFTTMSKMKRMESAGQGDAAAAKLIDARIRELGDWRGALLARVRALIKQADAEVVEEWKWRGVPVVACRDDLYGRDVQERCEADVCERSGVGGSRAPLQLQFGRQRAARD